MLKGKSIKDILAGNVEKRYLLRNMKCGQRDRKTKRPESGRTQNSREPGLSVDTTRI